MWWVFFIFWDTFQLLLSSSNKAFFSKGNVCKRSFLLLIGISLPSLTSLVFYNKLFLFLWTNHTLNSKEQLGCEVSLYKYHCISVVCAVQSTTNLTEMQSCPAVKAFLFDIAFFFFFEVLFLFQCNLFILAQGHLNCSSFDVCIYSDGHLGKSKLVFQGFLSQLQPLSSFVLLSKSLCFSSSLFFHQNNCSDNIRL